MDFVPPTVDELNEVNKLKSKLIENNVTYPVSDIKVLRFLRGRKRIFDKALNGLMKHVEWRDEFHVDNIINETSSFTKEFEEKKLINQGFDRKGRPIMIIIARRHKKDNRDINQIRSYIISTLENLLKRSNPMEEKVTILFDLSGFSLACMDYEVVQMIINILQYNYPEILALGIILNAPMLFSACWAVIKPWLDPVTAAKIIFTKPAQLNDYIDLSELPIDVAGLPTSGTISATSSSVLLASQMNSRESLNAEVVNALDADKKMNSDK